MEKFLANLEIVVKEFEIKKAAASGKQDQPFEVSHVHAEQQQ